MLAFAGVQGLLDLPLAGLSGAPWLWPHPVQPLFALLASDKHGLFHDGAGGFQVASLTMQLAAIGLVLVLSIVIERFALRVGIPGALALFGCGVAIQPISSFDFEHRGFAGLHVVALSLLLFYSGVKICRRYFSRQDFLVPSLLLSVFGVFVVIIFGSALVYFGLSAFSPGFVTSNQPVLIALAMAFCMAPLDWGAFTFIVRRVERFSDKVMGVLEFETAISAAMTLVVGRAMLQFFTDQGARTMVSKAANIFIAGISEGIVVGVVMGYLLSLAIKHYAVERSQSIDLAVGFVMIANGVNAWLGQGGLVCCLVMGIVVSFLLSKGDNKDEKEMLAVQLESINIACESLIFFMAGLCIDLSVGLAPTLLGGLLLVAVILLLRPLTVHLFFSSSTFLEPKEKAFLSLWSPKGAISMALAITIPDMIEETGIRYEQVIHPVSEHFVVDAVCFAVVFSMLIKSLVLPGLHRQMLGGDRVEPV